MKFQFNLFLAALGLALVIEGLPYFLAPDTVKRMAVRMQELPASTLRLIGLLSMVGGLVVVALSRLLS